MVPTICTLLAVVIVSVAALSAAQGDLGPGKRDKDRKISYAAAEAGVQNYLYHLAQDPNYWAKCTTGAQPHAVNDPWNGSGADTRVWRTLPGSTARYTIELLPSSTAPTGTTMCSVSSPDATMIDTGSGTFRIRATGQDRIGGVKRSLIANFKRQSLLDYIYFTDKEHLDMNLYDWSSGGYPTDDQPGAAAARDVTQWGRERCDRYWGDDPATGGRGGESFFGAGGAANTGILIGGTWRRFSAACVPISFAGSDVVAGPLHTNDEILVCGSPATKFGRAPADRIEVFGAGMRIQSPPSPTAGYRGCSVPYVNFGSSTSKADAGHWVVKPETGLLKLPPTNTQLVRDTDDVNHFLGATKIVVNGTSMTVTGKRKSDGLDLVNVTVPLPADGVVYVSNSGACPLYSAIDTYSSPATCGNLQLEGTYGANITFGAENDIIVTDDLKRATGSEFLLGLISNNFIRVYHPVTMPLTRSVSVDGAGNTIVKLSCNPAGGPGDITIEAAILSVTHSFITDNFFCGGPIGSTHKLTVLGAIAQKFRGAVATSAGSALANGYLKAYTYDNRLKYRSPPHFLDPVNAAWRLQTFTEQTPAR